MQDICFNYQARGSSLDKRMVCQNSRLSLSLGVVQLSSHYHSEAITLSTLVKMIAALMLSRIIVLVHHCMKSSCNVYVSKDAQS